MEELHSQRIDEAKQSSAVNVLNTEVFCAPDAFDSGRKPGLDSKVTPDIL